VITGTTGTFTNISGNGVSLTAINASNITSGTIANARTTAASANGASTIVARDANGSFAANVVTATSGSFTSVSGNGSALTALNGSNIASGTVANARTTAATANGASTIVARDASGNFTGNTITAASFSGAGTGLTGTASSLSIGGNAGTATTLQNARTIQGVSFNGSANITVATAGTGIGVSGTTITNNGVTSIVAGTNITISGGTGAVTINASGGSTAYGAVGTYVMASIASSVAIDSTYAGSSLIRSTASDNWGNGWAGYLLVRVGENTGLSLSGTWRALGQSTITGSYTGLCLFVRIS
jgi:hypothetical protein